MWYTYCKGIKIKNQFNLIIWHVAIFFEYFCRLLPDYYRRCAFSRGVFYLAPEKFNEHRFYQNYADFIPIFSGFDRIGGRGQAWSGHWPGARNWAGDSIVAGTKYRGEFEKRLKAIADEITAAQRSIILFIDEIHTLAQAGGAEGAIDADDILKPALARGDLQVIGATTGEEYKKFIKQDVTLDRRLHPILIDEPTRKETISILKGIKRKYEQFHKVNITDEAILTAVHLAAEHIKDKSFPDKAIDLMDEAASKVSIENIDDHLAAEKKGQKPKLDGNKAAWPQVGVADVQAVMQEWLESQLI